MPRIDIPKERRSKKCSGQKIDFSQIGSKFRTNGDNSRHILFRCGQSRISSKLFVSLRPMTFPWPRPHSARTRFPILMFAVENFVSVLTGFCRVICEFVEMDFHQMKPKIWIREKKRVYIKFKSGLRSKYFYRFTCQSIESQAAPNIWPKLMNRRNVMDDRAKNSICFNGKRAHEISMHRTKGTTHYQVVGTNVNMAHPLSFLNHCWPRS